MANKLKDYVLVVVFILVIFGFAIVNLIAEDKDISRSERRKLQTFPEFKLDFFIDGSFIKDFEKYTLDQFVLRDTFRKVKAKVEYNVFGKKDNNKIFVKEDEIYKMEYPLNENSVTNSINKINKVIGKYLNASNDIYYTIVPDKNYFLSGLDDHLTMDYDKFIKKYNDAFKNMKYISIVDSLSKEDYYRTDIHWKQEKIKNVADVIIEGMGNKPLDTEYTVKDLGNFYGTYYGQSALNIKPDTLKIVESKYTKSAKVYNYENKKITDVYDLSKNASADRYDIYLSGPIPLLEITNNEVESGEELILFRDSFGSSITPYLMENYKKVYLVDIRYVSTDILDQFITFKDKDVLFMYSTLILNNSNILK